MSDVVVPEAMFREMLRLLESVQRLDSGWRSLPHKLHVDVDAVLQNPLAKEFSHHG